MGLRWKFKNIQIHTTTQKNLFSKFINRGGLGIPKPHAGSIVEYQPGQPNPYSAAVASIIKGYYVFGNLLECVDKLSTVMANFFRDLPNSGRIYLASRGIFLALNITRGQYNVFRYPFWGVSTVIQLCFTVVRYII